MNLPNQGSPMQGGPPQPGISPGNGAAGPPMGGPPMGGGGPMSPMGGQVDPGPSMGNMPPPQPVPETQDVPKPAKINIETVNIAKKMMKTDEGKRKVDKIGRDCKKGFDIDENSRREWLDQCEEWIKLAKQFKEDKMFPWRKASNIKYPLISTAAMQFAARAYPTLVPSDGQIVKAQVIGVDATGKKTETGSRVEKYMSWQVMHDMDTWEQDMDRMLIMLPVLGMMFKKTYYDKALEKVVSCLVYPENFVIDYWAAEIERVERFSEIMYVSPRILKERQAQEIYLDIDLGSAPQPAATAVTAHSGMPPPTIDETTPYMLIQQACWIDLDDDGIEEPYYVVFHKESSKVLRIYARFDVEGIKTDEDGDIISITPICQYTKFGFIPNPDGSFYDLGFGHLLGPINESVNTIINQLVDSGTLANLQSGFIGKGLRIKGGDMALQPGEWRVVNAVGDDIKKQLVQIPSKEPSNVLFQLLGMLITSGKELASVAEIFVGKMPGQNTPAYTTQASIEQGMKVFTAIYKRIYRALNKEFYKIFNLNGKYLDKDTAVAVLDAPIGPEDFDEDNYDICPAADPQAASQAEKLAKAQSLLELLQLGTLDPMEVTMRILQAQDQPNWQKLIPGLAETGKPQVQQKPDPKTQELQMKMQAQQQESQLKQQMMQQQAASDQQSQQADLAGKQQETQMKLQAKEKELQLKAAAQAHDIQAKMVQSHIQNQATMQQAHIQGQAAMHQARTQAAAGEITAAQKIQQSDESHKQKMQQAKETRKSQPKAKK